MPQAIYERLYCLQHTGSNPTMSVFLVSSRPQSQQEAVPPPKAHRPVAIDDLLMPR